MQDCDPSFRAHGAAGRPSTEAADGLAEERDPETYDDTEFYQTLLKEFLEGSGDVAGASNWYSVRPACRLEALHTPPPLLGLRPRFRCR